MAEQWISYYQCSGVTHCYTRISMPLALRIGLVMLIRSECETEGCSEVRWLIGQ